MIGTKWKVGAGLAVLAVALFGLGLGRLTVVAADAAGPGDKKLPHASGATGPIAILPDGLEAGFRGDSRQAVAEATAPGNDLVVRRPLGSYTREMPGYGKATLTFSESRLHVVADVRLEKLAFTITAAADYGMNRESMVYGIITGADLTSSVDAKAAEELAVLVGAVNDAPFAFRVRADEDAITIKDVKFGPFGSPLLSAALGGKTSEKESMFITGVIGGKYRLDPQPGRVPQPPRPQRVNPGVAPSKLKRQAAPPPRSSRAPVGPLPLLPPGLNTDTGFLPPAVGPRIPGPIPAPGVVVPPAVN